MSKNLFKGEIESAKRVGFNYNKHVNNAGSLEQYTLTYLVHTDTYQYAAVLLIYVKDGGAPELVGLRVVPADQAFDQGRILDFSNFNIVQALLILLSVASTGIIILAMVLCVKAKIRYKALWILAILLFQSGFKLSLMPNSFRFNVNIIAISLSSLRTFINGSSILTVILPLGAILFLILRKSLIRGAVRHAEKNQAASAAMDATGNPDAGDGEQYHHDSGNSNNG